MLTKRVGGLAIAVTLAASAAFYAFQYSCASPIPEGTYWIADKHGVTVKVVDGPLPCGFRIDAAGCFLPTDPNSIYIRAGLLDHRDRYVVAHEVAHVLQRRSGEAHDECAADAFAKKLVPKWDGSYRDAC